jgi:hypothetical protein
MFDATQCRVEPMSERLRRGGAKSSSETNLCGVDRTRGNSNYGIRLMGVPHEAEEESPADGRADFWPITCLTPINR